MNIEDVIEALNPNSSENYKVEPVWPVRLIGYLNKNNNEYVSLN
jgi:hypothetical protein